MQHAWCISLKINKQFQTHVCLLNARIHLPPDCESADELVPQRLGLGDGAQPPGGHLLGVELDGSLWEVEALLYDGRELADAPALLAEHVLRARRHDDDLGAGGGDAHLHAGVAILGELAGEELVQLGLEDAVGNELWKSSRMSLCT